MKIQGFSAKKVHGYINIELRFNDDVTFVTGLNGSGKTSALRLIMGLITPSLSELASIDFSQASLSIHTPSGLRIITADRTEDTLSIGLSGIAENLVFERRELLRFMDVEKDVKGRDVRDIMSLKGKNLQILNAISEIATPMFLGLGRAQYASELLWDDAGYEPRQREIWIRAEREMMLRKHGRNASPTSGLQTLQVLVHETIADLRRKNEALDATLRENILNEALKYIPFTHASFKLPERGMVERLREKERDIDATAKRLKLPELKASVSDFTARLATLIEKIDAEKPSKSTRKSTVSASASASANFSLILEWLANKTQADRVIKILEFVDAYTIDRAKLYDGINRFVEIVNSFFIQTGKEVVVAENGTLEFRMSKTSHLAKDVSSGEQQILIMLAHLALDRRLATSGVFIVDEPELSLHIAWQEMFVDAILKANPTCQVILATHSPAIIMDRDANCEIIYNQET